MRETDKLVTELRISYIQELGQASGFFLAEVWSDTTFFKNKDDLIYHLTAHLSLNAVYWGFTALCILGHPEALSRDEMINFVMSCWDKEAGIIFPLNHLYHYLRVVLPSLQEHSAPTATMMPICSLR
jgi:geranylgeranyl transferase type-2 subunit beta